MQPYRLLETHIAGEQLGGEVAPVVEPAQELHLGFFERKQYRETFAALGDEIIGPFGHVTSRRREIGSYHGDKLRLHLVRVNFNVTRRHRPPIFAVDTAVYDEAEAQFGRIEPRRGEKCGTGAGVTARRPAAR